jgi:adenine-specific DNA-methyltransferase
VAGAEGRAARHLAGEGKRLLELAKKGYAYVSSRDDVRATWTIKYLMTGTLKAIESGRIEVFGSGSRGEVLLRTAIALRTTAKTLWHRGRHTAGGAGGTQLLASLIGERDVFPFPKSVYAVRDAIAIAVGNRTDALIMDVFAGSGTTLNATCLLNAEDVGRRRCVLVTNNEVDAKTAAALRESGTYRGDPEFEARGIFERATRPRCEAAITGRRPDGAAVEGEYLDGRSYAQGFEENVEFYRLDYLDVDDVNLGRQFQAVLPLLWMTAGGSSPRSEAKAKGDWVLPAESPFGVLLNPDSFQEFVKELAARPDLTHVWIVTDDEQTFARMRAQLKRSIRVTMLYRDYLRNFIINTDRNV